MEWALIVGMAFVGYIVPEVFAAFGRVRVPVGMNLMSMAGFALIGSYIALK